MIVGSILLAFSIDAAWDRRLEREERIEVMSAIREDMSGTRAALADLIPGIPSSLDRTSSYRNVVIEARDIPLDSLGHLLTSTFQGFPVQPPLSSCDGAINSGRIVLLPGSVSTSVSFARCSPRERPMPPPRYTASSTRTS